MDGPLGVDFLAGITLVDDSLTTTLESPMHDAAVAKADQIAERLMSDIEELVNLSGFPDQVEGAAALAMSLIVELRRIAGHHSPPSLVRAEWDAIKARGGRPNSFFLDDAAFFPSNGGSK